VLGGLLGFGVKPLAAIPAAGLTSAGLHFLTGQPFSFTAIGTYQGVAMEIGLCFIGGLLVYLVLLGVSLRHLSGPERSDAAIFHLSCAALVHASVAPTYWLLMGFAIKAPLPTPELMFLPLFAGYIGALFTALAGLSWFAMAARRWRGARQ